MRVLLFIDLIKQALKRLLNVLSSLCTRLKVLHIVLVCQYLGLFSINLSVRSEVGLAAKDDCDHISDAIFGDRIDPVRGDCFKRLSARQVKADDNAVGLLVECRGEAVVSLLSSCVPNNDFIVFGTLYSLQSCRLLVCLNVINTKCRHPSVAEFLSGEYFSHASLTDSCFTH